MSIKSPNISALNSLFFAAGSLDSDNLEQQLEHLEDSSDRFNETELGCRLPSIYVEAFEDMVNRVHEFEHHLLTEKEWDIFSTFSGLCYNARYCLVRLLLRRPDRWHTRASMERFTKEVGEEGLHRALVDLCLPFTAPVKEEGTEIGIPVKEEPEIIDLTFDFDDDYGRTIIDTEAGPSSLDIPQISVQPGLDDVFDHLTLDSSDPDIDFFCRDQTTMTLLEVLNKLSTGELKDLVKSIKIKPRRFVKDEMISALMSHASTQSILDFTSTRKGKQKVRDDGLRQTKLSFISNCSKKERIAQKTQEGRLMEMALKKLGTCVTINHDFYKLIERINILDERSILFPKSLLLPALLTCFKKRKYPDYKHTRTSNIWSTREQLIQYVAALELEAVLDQALESSSESRRTGTKTPGPNAFVTPATPGPASIATPLRTPGSGSTLRYAETPASTKREAAYEEVVIGPIDDQDTTPPETLAKLEKAMRIKDAFDTWIIPRWKALVAARQEERARVRASELERFEPGFVYTRLFRRVQDALRTLKDYKGELEALEALLGQRYWRRRKRGTWYERRAILQTRYLCLVDQVRDDRVLFQAIDGVREALKDEDTGLVFRPSLLRRLRNLEKKLKIPQVDRATVERELRTADIISFSAVRLEKSATSLHLDTNLEHSEDVRKYLLPVKTDRASFAAEKENKPEGNPPANKPKSTGKSLWRGVNGEELNVEMRALQYYEGLEFKGFHSESRVLTTIFALIFWDILFADIPGAFETSYQTAPLDLAEETFYYARKAMIDTRLEEIKGGKAREILERHDDAHREKNTWCVGVQWDICQKQDLVEIVECLGGGPLSIICRLFCEDYEGRRSGVPDLVVWNAERCICKFVEVKGPGDRPQENQKLWFDSLLNAGAKVEICKVLDVNDQTKTRSKSKKKQKDVNRNTMKGKVKTRDSDFESEEEEDHFTNPMPPTQKSGPVLSSKKRSRPPDDQDDSLPVLPFSSPTSPLDSISIRASAKRPKLGS